MRIGGKHHTHGLAVAEPSAEARLAEIPAVTPAATITLRRKNARGLVPIPFVMIASLTVVREPVNA